MTNGVVALLQLLTTLLVCTLVLGRYGRGSMFETCRAAGVLLGALLDGVLGGGEMSRGW